MELAIAVIDRVKHQIAHKIIEGSCFNLVIVKAVRYGVGSGITDDKGPVRTLG